MLQPLPSAAANPAAPIEAVDQLLRWVLPDETLSTFVARQNREATRTGVALIDTHTTLRPGPVLEIAGPSGTAKTELLIQVCRRLIYLRAARMPSVSCCDQGALQCTCNVIACV
jgi:hypothetical protein